MRQKHLLYGMLAIVAVSAGCKPHYDETRPKNGPVTEAVFASGSIEPLNAYILTSLYDGFIIKSYVTENDVVHKGQLLFRLDNKQQHVQVEQAMNNVTYAKVNASGSSPQLLQLKAQIDAARAKLVNDSVNMVRYGQLYTTHSVSKQDYDNARLNYTSSLSSYQALQESYRSTSLKVKQDLDNSLSQLQNAQAGNQYYDLTAVEDGRVYQIFKKEGELARKGDQVAQLGDKDTLIITLDVDEGTINKIQLGQQVLVELNTQKNKTYEAYISKIYPHFNESSQSYKVEARFTKDVPGLIAGTQLQANIIVSKKDNALVIPRSYLVGENKVLLQSNKKIDTVSITTGIVSDDWVEVLSGLTTNDKIVKQR